MAPTEKVAPGLCEEVNVAMAQLSAAVGSVQATSAEQLPASLVWVMSAGMPLMAGSSSSVTVTVKVLVVVLPWMSVAVKVTVVEPTGKVSPLSWLEVNVAIAQLSAALGAVKETAALQLPASLVCVMSAGVPLVEGASSSVTVTLKLADVELPALSTAV